MFQSVFTDEIRLDVIEAMSVLKSWGLTHVDFRGRIFGRKFEDLTDEQLKELKFLLDQHELKVGCLQSSLGKVHLPDKQTQADELKKLEGVIRAADALDCRLVRAFFFWQPRPTQDNRELDVQLDALQNVLDLFAPIARRAKKADLVLAFENCGVTTDEVLAVVDALNEPTWGIAWDPSNEWSSDRRKADEEAYVKRLTKATRAVHIKANGAIQGLGERVPYDRIFQALKKAGYPGPVSVETHNPDKSVQHLDQTRRVLKVVRQAWPGMAAAKLSVVREYKPVGFVVVGMGKGKQDAKKIQSTPGTKLIGICDLDESLGKKCSTTFGVPYKINLADWLKDDQVEAVYIVTSTGSHGKLAMQALEAGRHVLLTKPMEASLDACDAMIRLSESKKLLLAVDFDMRFAASSISLRQTLRGGHFGRMLGGQATLKMLRGNDYYQRWRIDPSMTGGGAMCTQGIHYIDFLAFTLGVPSRVRCDTWKQMHEISDEDLGCSTWEYPDGAAVMFLCTTSYPGSSWYSEVELHGTEGAVSLASGGPLTHARSRWFANGSWSDHPPMKAQSQWLNAPDNLADAVRTGAPLVCTGRDARRSQAILEAMYRSARAGGGWVPVEAELSDADTMPRSGVA